MVWLPDRLSVPCRRGNLCADILCAADARNPGLDRDHTAGSGADENRMIETALAWIAVTPWSTWLIACIATAGVILRPFAWPEFIWAIVGALLLVVLGLLPWQEALHGVARGTDVYLFLVGMMLLAEL